MTVKEVDIRKVEWMKRRKKSIKGDKKEEVVEIRKEKKKKGK